MKNLPFLVLCLILILLGSGCQHLSSPSLSSQQKFFKSLKVANPGEEAAMRCAQYYNLIGRFDLALQELSKAVASDPHNVRLLNAMATCYDNLGRYARAQEIYEVILEQNANDFAAKNNLGYSCYLSGDFSRAEKIFQEILSVNPNDFLARNNLGLLWSRQGRESQALALWQKTEGEIQAREKLDNVLASLGKSNSQEAAKPAPKNKDPQLAAVLKNQADQKQREFRSTASTSHEINTALKRESGSAADLMSASPSSISNPIHLTQKPVQKPVVKVEEVKMLIKPATYAEISLEEKSPKKQDTSLSFPFSQNEKQSTANLRHEAKEFVLDDSLLQDEVEIADKQAYFHHPRQLPKSSKPKIITFDPMPQESQSIKKCLFQEVIYQSQNASRRQEVIF
jgi:Tfp pilus assembly protein PilF